ncbi:MULTISPECIES: hypothetical protein [unclassified Bradyrhizobium]|uniref:hypothetical protein n=1 Tax=unclassified Bradyrhizobium TaxID=2631580 RepID=UPI002FF3F587
MDNEQSPNPRAVRIEFDQTRKLQGSDGFDFSAGRAHHLTSCAIPVVVNWEYKTKGPKALAGILRRNVVAKARK